MQLISILESAPTTWITVALVLGLLVGSFLNVVIYRLPKMMEREWRTQAAEFFPDCASPSASGESETKFNLVVPHSACPACGHKISPLENIPVLSYLVLKGRCAGCKKPISARYPIVELVSGIGTALLAWHYGFTPQAWAAILLLWALVALTLIDFDTKFLPDSITQPLLWAGLLINYFGVFTDLQSALLGAVLGYLSLWSVYWLFKLATGKEGMGYGDFKLLAALGAWLGWQKIPVIILLSSVVGAVVGIVLMVLARRGRDTQIPFGPYLAGGGLIALVGGQSLLQAYLDGF